MDSGLFAPRNDEKWHELDSACAQQAESRFYPFSSLRARSIQNPESESRTNPDQIQIQIRIRI
ncbi:hypothetical protein [Helicobacter fennelliae]|uniref:hypothetical protein n=1 Tax=Helicobacter fennelliae TaxID=215 RepID=UPI0011BE3100|nr:hypothetical protein [Helicobacter fennelliae]